MKNKTFKIYQFNNNNNWLLTSLANLFVTLCFIVAITLFVFSCISAECVVVGDSMIPTYNSDPKADNDVVFVNKFDKDYKFGDIVVINIANADPIIKRVIGVGGDVIDIVYTDYGYKLEINGKIIDEDYINYKYDRDMDMQNGMKDYYILFTGDMRVNFPELFNEQGKLVVPIGEYFVLGDNRHESKDSMYYGTFKGEDFVGTVENLLEAGESKFSFYVNYVIKGKIFTSILNCF